MRRPFSSRSGVTLLCVFDPNGTGAAWVRARGRAARGLSVLDLEHFEVQGNGSEIHTVLSLSRDVREFAGSWEGAGAGPSCDPVLE